MKSRGLLTPLTGSPPGRTSTIHRSGQDRAVPLSSFPGTAASCGRAAQLQYRAYSSGGSYVGVPGAESPVVPAPGQFQEDSITC